MVHRLLVLSIDGIREQRDEEVRAARKCLSGRAAVADGENVLAFIWLK